MQLLAATFVKNKRIFLTIDLLQQKFPSNQDKLDQGKVAFTLQCRNAHISGSSMPKEATTQADKIRAVTVKTKLIIHFLVCQNVYKFYFERKRCTFSSTCWGHGHFATFVSCWNYGNSWMKKRLYWKWIGLRWNDVSCSKCCISVRR